MVSFLGNSLRAPGTQPRLLRSRTILNLLGPLISWFCCAIGPCYGSTRGLLQPPGGLLGASPEPMRYYKFGPVGKCRDVH